jgi:glycosyltransferase involved in cell wall biosynthesis
MKITLVGINYRPELTGIAPYSAGIAEGLAARGHEVTVVTGLPHYPEWRVAESYDEAVDSPTVVNGVLVRRVRHYVPETPTPRGRVRMEVSFAKAILNADWGSPEVVVAVSPSLLGTAAVVARARGIPVGIIVQDLYSRGVVETGAMRGRPASAVAWLERQVLRKATAVSVIHSRFVDALAAIGVEKNHMTIIRNWVHIGDVVTNKSSATTRSEFGWAPEEIIVMHTGNMGVKQGLENVVAAAKLLDESAPESAPIRFVLIGDGNRRRKIEEISHGVSCLELRQPLPSDDFRAALNAADILLVNEKRGVGEMAVPSKLTTYFAAGKPIVAATDANSGSAEEMRSAGAGLVIAPDQPRALLEAIRTISVDSEMKKNFGVSGERYAHDLLSAEHALSEYEAWIAGLRVNSRAMRMG